MLAMVSGIAYVARFTTQRVGCAERQGQRGGGAGQKRAQGMAGEFQQALEEIKEVSRRISGASLV